MSLNSKKRIAVVDDELDVLEIYKDVLSHKYEVIDFARPEEFLQYLASPGCVPFDLLITDFRMGRISGIDMVIASKKIKEDIPFILLSGFLDKEATLSAHNLGAHKILEKPINIASLEQEVKKLIIFSQIKEMQKNNKELFGKLKELCGLFDMFIDGHSNPDVVNDFFLLVHSIDNPTEKVNFTDYIRSIEDQAYRNMKIEDHLVRELKKEAA